LFLILLRRLLLGLAALLWAMPVLNAALPKLDPSPQGSTLAGQFLIAAPSMRDPRFQRTVILMVKHGKDGALGLVLNRPVGEETRTRFLEGLGEKSPAVEGSLRLFVGGPVQPEIGFVVHTDDYRRKETITVNDRLAVTSSREALVDVGYKRGPEKVLIAFGYAGWAAGQLEGELARDDWFLGAADLDLVFDEPREKVWGLAMARRPKEP
jgi:putative transcriptional regulator